MDEVISYGVFWKSKWNPDKFTLFSGYFIKYEDAYRGYKEVQSTPQNISDPEIALGEDNLELLCRDCHALAHAGELATDSGLTFDDEGNVVKRPL